MARTKSSRPVALRPGESRPLARPRGKARRAVLACLVATGIAAGAGFAPAAGRDTRKEGAQAAGMERALTLEDAIALAMERNPRVLKAGQGLDAARGRRLQLEAVPNPELTFEALGLPLWSSAGEREFSLGLSQLIEFPGKRSVRKELGLAGEAEAGLEFERVRKVVRGQVKRAYLRAAYAQRRLAELESILSTLDEYTSLAVERYKSGQVPYLDVIRGRLETLRLRNDLVEARRELKDRGLALNLLLGGRGFEPFEFSSGIPYEPLGLSREELEAAALSGSALRLAESARKQADLSLTLARKARLPDFSMGLFVPSKRLGSWGVEFGLTLPLRGGAFRGAALEAEAAARQAELTVGGTTRGVLYVLARAYEDATALEEQIRLFQDTLLRDVQESLQAALAGYRYGKSDALGVLDIVRGLKESRAEFLRALLNHSLALVDIATAGEGGDIGVEDGEY